MLCHKILQFQVNLKYTDENSNNYHNNNNNNCNDNDNDTPNFSMNADKVNYKYFRMSPIEVVLAVLQLTLNTLYKTEHLYLVVLFQTLNKYWQQ